MQLGFDYEFEYDNDEVYFAYSVPYTYSMLLSFLQHLAEIQRQNII